MDSKPQTLSFAVEKHVASPIQSDGNAKAGNSFSSISAAAFDLMMKKKPIYF